jgi:hypothetical protein
MKIVINRDYGGFGLSNKATEMLAEKKGVEVEELDIYDIPRNDADLVSVVEELGLAAEDEFSKLAIVSIPDGVKFMIDEYDGMESIHEVHRIWT